VVVADRLAAGKSYDLVLLDAFDDKGPARALLEENFLRRCRMLLAHEGVFAMNLWNRPVDNFPAILANLSALFEQRIYKLALADVNRNAIVFGFNEQLPVHNLMELKQASRKLSRRTGINFLRWLRQIHWQNI
jgi:spermidine synthase